MSRLGEVVAVRSAAGLLMAERQAKAELFRAISSLGAAGAMATHSPEMIRSAGLGEFDSRDTRESVPLSCRLVDATSGNKQQLPILSEP